MKLYELSESIRGVLADAEETGELDYERMVELENSFSDKIQSCAFVMREMEAEKEAFDLLIKELSAKKSAISNKAEGLKDYMRYQMESVGQTKVKGSIYTISLGKPSQSVMITGEVDSDYQVVRVSEDKTAISKALKAGEAVNGAELVDGKARLTIK